MALRIRVDKTANENDVFQKNPQEAVNQQKSVRDNAINAALVNSGKQILIQSANKVGNHIGKSYEVRRANELIGLGTDAYIAFSSPIGAIAIASKYAMQVADSFMEQQRQNMEWNLAWQRSGNSVLGRQ